MLPGGSEEGGYVPNDGTNWDDEEFLEWPPGSRPVGGRYEDERPVGGRPVGGRPVGGRPVGGRPVGGRPVGGRPVGGRPVGGRPVGGRPVGGRPVGGRFAGGEFGAFDPDEWSADVAAVVCERSAVIRLGATLVATEDQVWIPESIATADMRPAKSPAAGSSIELRPRGHMLEAMVAVQDALAGRVAEQPTLGAPVEADLGDALSRVADSAFLAGLQHAVSNDGIEVATGADLLETLRAVTDAVLSQDPRPAFRSPGWILHPDLLDRVLRIRTIDGEHEDPSNAARSLSSFGLLKLVSAGEGMLLGFPFVISFEATDGAGPEVEQPRIYFASDWQEAFVAIDPSFVTVDLPAEPIVADATVIRASMPVDFALRRKTAFAWADPPP